MKELTSLRLQDTQDTIKKDRGFIQVWEEYCVRVPILELLRHKESVSDFRFQTSQTTCYVATQLRLRFQQKV